MVQERQASVMAFKFKSNNEKTGTFKAMLLYKIQKIFTHILLFEKEVHSTF